jgi:hypothetical protein
MLEKLIRKEVKKLKHASQIEVYAIATILVILVVFGIKSGLEFILMMKPSVNLLKIAFAGFISFAIVGAIMAVGSKMGIWFGKIGGSILYVVVLYLIGSLFF